MFKTIKDFYSSPDWKKCRAAYISTKTGLCERCLKDGKIVPAREVHHKIRLTDANINDPSIALNFDNLEALCIQCHDKEHEQDARARRQKKPERYKADPETGKVITAPEDGMGNPTSPPEKPKTDGPTATVSRRSRKTHQG